MPAISAYAELEHRFRRLAALEGASSMLYWDQSAMMPPGGAKVRASQLAELKLVRHEMLTDPRLGELIDRAGGETLEPWQSANLREMGRRRCDATALEPRLVEALARASSEGDRVWLTARPASDFAAALPILERLVGLAREAGTAKGERLGLSPYDALLDGYEPGGRAARTDALFAPLAAALPDLLARITERQRREPTHLRPSRPFPAALQRALGLKLMATAGFDFEHGRLDESAHPFCGGVADDLRLTTRYDEADFVSGLMGVLHETGHALYEQGLPKAWREQPVGEPRGMAAHESQSLLMEMQACRSPEFLGYLAPLLVETFGEDPAFAPANLRRVYARVEPGFIRVTADEVTYPAHVILRYRLERALIAGDLAPADLPGAWAEGLKGLLGIVPPNDRLGCLQDPHWFGGDFGYFPTYTLGAMAAAQLHATALAERPGIPAALGRGDFTPLLGWLREKVHGLGSLHATTDELLTEATGRPLDPAIFLAHLNRRYLGG